MQLGGRMHVSKVDLLDVGISYVREVLLMVSDSVVPHFGSYFVYLIYSETTKQLRSRKPCNLAMAVLLHLPCGPIGDKSDAAHGSWPIAYGLLRPETLVLYCSLDIINFLR